MHEHLTNPLGFSQEENNPRPVHLPGAAGIDEAGRGCLAGPLVAAGVAFNPHALGRRARNE